MEKIIPGRNTHTHTHTHTESPEPYWMSMLVHTGLLLVELLCSTSFRHLHWFQRLVKYWQTGRETRENHLEILRQKSHKRLLTSQLCLWILQRLFQRPSTSTLNIHWGLTARRKISLVTAFMRRNLEAGSSESHLHTHTRTARAFI